MLFTGAIRQRPKEQHLLCMRTYLMPRMLVITCLASMFVTDTWSCSTSSQTRSVWDILLLSMYFIIIYCFRKFYCHCLHYVYQLLVLTSWLRLLNSSDIPMYCSSLKKNIVLQYVCSVAIYIYMASKMLKQADFEIFWCLEFQSASI